MAKKKRKQTANGAPQVSVSTQDNKNRFMLILVCIFMSAVILAGAVLGTVFAVRAANSAAEYNGVRMSSKVANYFASYAKGVYLTQVLADVEGAEDTEEFWNSYEKGLTTYGEGMKKYVGEYIAMIVAGCYLFDSVATLDSETKAAIRDNAEQRLLYIADGDKREFNSLVEKYGFDYDAFYTATEMMYKSVMAQFHLYGTGGEALKNDTELVNEFYNLSYKRVKLLFIRTERDFELDGDGKRKTDAEGNDELFLLTAGQKAEREQDIAAIDEAIANLEAGESNNQMSEISFSVYLQRYAAANLGLDPDGEYYSASSDYANGAFKEFPEVVMTALSMEKGSYKKVEIEDVGVCYIYATDLQAGAYTDTKENGPFSDFYTDLAEFKYKREVAALIEEVNLTDRFYEIDLIALPKNGIYTIGI